MSAEILQYTGGPVMCNGYLVKGPEGYVAVDAPLGFAEWAAKKLPEGAQITHLLITHQHFDHVQGAAELQRRTGCRIHACKPYGRDLTLEDMARGWDIGPMEAFQVDDAFGAGKTSANWGGLDWQIYSIPGHSPDGVAYGISSEGLLFTGDILFAGSVGRTDLPGGSMRALVTGIREKLMVLDPETVVYCGHGPSTDIQEEMLSNPYASA